MSEKPDNDNETEEFHCFRGSRWAGKDQTPSLDESRPSLPKTKPCLTFDDDSPLSSPPTEPVISKYAPPSKAKSKARDALRRLNLKQRLYQMLMDQANVTRLTIGSLGEQLQATPEELIDLARDHDVQDAADKTWSILAVLAAPAALATLRDSLHDEDPKIQIQAAKELLNQARKATNHQIDQQKLLVSLDNKKAQPPEQVKDIAQVIEEAKRAVSEDQNGISS